MKRTDIGRYGDPGYRDTSDFRSHIIFEPVEPAHHTIITRTEHSCRRCDGTGEDGWAGFGNAPYNWDQTTCELCDGYGDIWRDPLLFMHRYRHWHNNSAYAKARAKLAPSPNWIKYRHLESSINLKEIT